MGLNLGVMSAAVVLDDSDYRRKLSGLENQSESSFKRIAQMAATFLSARALFNFTSGAMAEFSKVEEGANKLKYTFTEIHSAAKEAAETIEKTFGLSEQTATNAIANIGDLLTGFGLSQRKALEMAKQITERGIDVASFKGLDQTETIQRMTVALTGQTTTLESMGIIIRQGSEEFKNQVNAIMDATGATETQAKAQAILNEIMKQTQNSAGDYLRPDAPRTYAQEITDLTEAVRRFKAEAGAQLQPITQEAVVKARELLTIYNESDSAAKNLVLRISAITAGLALAAKYGAVSKANALLSSAVNAVSGGGLSQIKKDAEADQVAASQNLIRAEYEKTNAYREAHAATQSARIARLDTQEKQAAVNAAQYELQKAKQSGNASQLLSAKKTLAAASHNLTKAQLAESQALSEVVAKHNIARTATLQHTVAVNANTVAVQNNARAATLSGRMQIALASGFNKAKVAANAFAASLGPIGAAMIALSAAYMAYNYIMEKNKSQIEGQITLAQKRVDAVNEEVAANAKARTEDTARLSRLEELSKYERLSNSEKKEAEQLIQKLTAAYGSLGISLDSTTGKLVFAASAWDNLNDAQAKAMRKDLSQQAGSNQALLAAMQVKLRNELGSFWRNTVFNQLAATLAQAGVAGLRNIGLGDIVNSHENIERTRYSKYQNELDDILKLQSEEKQLAAFEQMRNRMLKNGENEQAEAVQKVIDLLKKQIELNKQLENSKKSPQQEKIKELDEQIQKIFDPFASKFKSVADFKKADKNSLSQEELSALKQIMELEEKRARISREIANNRSGQDAAEKAAQKQAEAERKALDDLTGKEWSIKFNTAKSEQQLSMLNAKIQETFRKQASGKYKTLDDFRAADRSKLTLDEIKALSQIIELEEKRAEINKRIADERKRAVESVKQTREASAMNDADDAQKIDLLEKKIAEKKDELNKTAVGKQESEYAADELNKLNQILRLEQQINEIRKRSKNGFQSEQDSYADMQRQRQKQQENKAIDRNIENARINGNQAEIDAIMKREFERARNAAEQMKTEYERAVADAEKDGILTEEEKKRVAKLRDKLRETLSDQDKWQDRIDDEKKKDSKNSQAVGSWSLAQLAQSLNAPSAPEKETARNTRLTVNLLRSVKSNTSQKTSETTYE